MTLVAVTEASCHPAALSRQRRRLGVGAVEYGSTQLFFNIGIPACQTSDIHHDAAYLPADLSQEDLHLVASGEDTDWTI